MYRRMRTPVVLWTVVITVAATWCSAAEEPATAPREPDVIYLPTPQDVVVRMLKEANVTAKDLVYDLGCGDGRIPVTAAKKYGCRGVGYDIDPERIKESRENVKKNKVEKLVSIHQKDIFKLDLSKASVVTLYLLPELNVRLIPQLKKLKPGARIVSHDFNMRGVKPDKRIRMRSKQDGSIHTIYLWKAPIQKGQGSKNTYSILRIDKELQIKKASEVRAMRKQALSDYKEALKAWRNARKAATEAGQAFSNPKPKRKVLKTVASGLATEEAARKKLQELNGRKKQKTAGTTAAGGS